MKFQSKLWLILSVFGMTIGVCSVVLLPGAFRMNGAGAAERAVVCLLAAVAILGFSYLIAVTISRRLVLLAAKAETVRLHPDLQQIDIPGRNDEIASLASVINELVSKLTKGEQIRNQLVADVAHELRTPVTIIRGHLETMLKGAEELKPENLLPLLDETKRMSRLIQDMRDLNLAEAGRLQLDREWVSIAAMLREIVSIMETEAEAKEVGLRLEGDWEGEVYCDESRVKQVLVNLIGNAIRYVPEHGEVAVVYAHRSGVVRIKVSDNGPGIAPEHLPYLFKRFYRVEASRNRMLGGTGLGLAIAKEFIEAHGGTVHVASRVGEGTAFELSLPVYPLAP